MKASSLAVIALASSIPGAQSVDSAPPHHESQPPAPRRVRICAAAHRPGCLSEPHRPMPEKSYCAQKRVGSSQLSGCSHAESSQIIVFDALEPSETSVDAPRAIDPKESAPFFFNFSQFGPWRGVPDFIIPLLSCSMGWKALSSSDLDLAGSILQ